MDSYGLGSGKRRNCVWKDLCEDSKPCFPAERLSGWVTDLISTICDDDLASAIDFMPPPTRTQAAITEIIGISLNTSTPIIINHESIIGASRSYAQFDKANFNPINHFGFHLQGRPLAVGAFSSATQRKFIILDKMQFSELLSRVGFYRGHSFLPECRHQVSLWGGAVQWSGLLCPSVDLDTSYTPGRSLQQKGGPCSQYILKKYNCCRASASFSSNLAEASSKVTI